MTSRSSRIRELGRALDILLDPGASSDEEGWRRAVSQAVVRLLDGDHAYVQIAAAPTLYVGTGIDDDTFGALEREFAETSAQALRYEDPEMERLHRLGRRTAGNVFSRESVSLDMGVRVEDTRIYREVCVPAGMEDFLGITAQTRLGDTMLWVSRKGRRSGWKAHGLPYLEALRPAFDAALRGLETAADPWPDPAEVQAGHGLTAREAEVALLLARGASEKAVARTLGISVHTARRHTEKVFRKLGVHARGQVAAALLDLPAGS